MGIWFNWICVALIIASITQLSEAACGELTSCTSHANCVAGKACIGEEGHKYCRECLCNLKSQCILTGNSVNCNCDGSSLKGPRCDCETSTLTNDCTEYSSELFTITHHKINSLQSVNETTTVNDYRYCKKECINSENCFATYQTYDTSLWTVVCNMYFDPTDKNLLINNIVPTTSGNDHLSFRKCL
ncbi:uncharacterized protein LOC132738558 [Ruditapes philippinarum]|uniref:uncharacterized protein LOC132738558 n=1 Tax=Ruditapes philippinarum TaxID=129788 RepID=UPI00295A59A8|nr:uncharacterized protein LOC132738558 [Ruditapes philippinarum]